MKRTMLLFFAVCGAFALNAQSVEAVLTQYFANTGGLDNWHNLTTTRMEAKMAMQGMEFPGTVISKKPNKQRVEVNIQGMRIVQAYDGETAWWINPFASGEEAQPMPDEMSEQLTNQEFESPFLDYEAKGNQVEYEGTGEVEGAAAHILKLTKKNGDVEYHYFDAEHFVLIMSKTPIKTGPMKGQFAETYFSDFQEVDGMIFPFYMEVKMDGQSVQKMTFTSITTNEEYEDGRFAFPKK